MKRTQGISYTYEQIPPLIKGVADQAINNHIKNNPEEEFVCLFTYYDDGKGRWMAEPYFQMKSESDLIEN